jgi:hypothetical protein
MTIRLNMMKISVLWAALWVTIAGVDEKKGEESVSSSQQDRSLLQRYPGQRQHGLCHLNPRVERLEIKFHQYYVR